MTQRRGDVVPTRSTPSLAAGMVPKCSSTCTRGLSVPNHVDAAPPTHVWIDGHGGGGASSGNGVVAAGAFDKTQNTNVPACRFYRRMGCERAAIDRFAYANLPDEAQLIWVKEL